MAILALFSDPIDASTALSWGLVSRVVPGEVLMPEARRLAGRIAVNPPRQLRMAKRLLRESKHSRLPEILELSAAFQGICHQTRDHEEAVASLLEKRPPEFTGS